MRKIIRLTENDLHKIVKNSIKRVLRESMAINEVGDTPKGQYMLGKLAAKHFSNDDEDKGRYVEKYAFDNNYDTNNYDKGYFENFDYFRYCNKETLKELNEFGYNVNNFKIIENARVAKFHEASRGYTITYNGEFFGELWQKGGTVFGNAEMPSGTIVSFSSIEMKEYALAEMMEKLLDDLNGGNEEDDNDDMYESRQRGKTYKRKLMR